jgi:hypothetical protein
MHLHTSELEIQGRTACRTAVQVAVLVMALASEAVLVTRTVKDPVIGSPIWFANHGVYCDYHPLTHEVSTTEWSKVRTRILKETSVSFTEIGLGAATLATSTRASSDQDAEEAVKAAWRAGIRYFDTAPHYGLGLKLLVDLFVRIRDG